MSAGRAASLAELVERYPIPREFGAPESFESEADVCGLFVRMAGLAVAASGECVTGSAASVDENPLPRAYLELLERLAVVAGEASQVSFPCFDDARRPRGTARLRDVLPVLAPAGGQVWSRSNGVAIGATLEDAMRRARDELIERDRVLRSWFGESPPRPVDDPWTLSSGALDLEYRFATVEFPARAGTLNDRRVAGAFAFPRGAAPFACGFGARETLAGAVEAARRECLQVMGFLWGEDLPDSPPPVAPTPAFHQAHYLFRGHQARLEAWLAGDRAGAPSAAFRPAGGDTPSYLDLTPEWLDAGRLRVVKALPGDEVPLAFGSGHPYLRGPVAQDLAVHPVA